MYIRLTRQVIRRVPGVKSLVRRRLQQRARDVRQEYGQLSGKPRVFITGDQGRLGSNVAAFLKAEYDIIGYDLKASPAENLLNVDLLRDRMRGCKYVIHTAGIPHPDKGTVEDYVQANLVGSLNVMQAAAANGVQRFIFFSTVGYYGCNIKGKLTPSYFPIDEDHPVASEKGRAEGKLDAYNQSKVMTEGLLAYFGTNQLFQAIALRIAPANTKADQYPANDPSWRHNPQYRRGSFWANCHPDYVAQAVKLAMETRGEFWYEAFNICDKCAPEAVDVPEFLKAEYPKVPLKCDFNGPPYPSLISTEKAQRLLGYQPCEDVR